MDATHRHDLGRLDELDLQRFEAKLAQLRTEVDAACTRQTTSLIWIMFAFWAATVVPLAALMIALSIGAVG